MLVTLEQAKRGISNFYEREFAQKADGLGKFAAYFMMPSVPGIVEKNINKYRSSPMMEGLINSDGLIDLDAFRDRATAAMQKCSSVEIMGFRLNNEDILNLYDYIIRA